VSDAGEVAHAGLRGAIAAMAMSGMREFTGSLGLLEQSPPQAVVRKRARGLLRQVPRRQRRAAVELIHWGYGAIGGVAYGMLPAEVRRREWSGPVFGLVTWLGFELGLAPALGLKHAKRPRIGERIALAADHALYGFVLSETRARPRR
jgi:hypothetical protein